jgi:hypothetical protein
MSIRKQPDKPEKAEETLASSLEADRFLGAMRTILTLPKEKVEKAKRSVKRGPVVK